MENHSTVGVLHWENCICDDLENQFTKHTGIWIPENESRFTKIIIPKELYGILEERYLSLRVTTLFDSKGIEFRKSKIGTMIHVPPGNSPSPKQGDFGSNSYLDTVIKIKVIVTIL